jgi:porin
VISTRAVLRRALLVAGLAAAGPQVFAQSPAPPATTAQKPAPTPPVAVDPFAGALPGRSTLTGDWGGRRAALQARGYNFTLNFTQFAQGLASGAGTKTTDYSGVVDLFVNVDTEKAGLWKSGGIGSHIVTNYGETTFLRGGALFPANTAMLEPEASGSHFEVSSLYLTQKMGSRGTLMAGKINAFDLLAADPYMGGLGVDRFMSVIFAAPPSGLVPPILFGALASFRTTPVAWTFMVFDPKGQWGKSGLDRLFRDGVNMSAGATIPTTVGGLSGSHALSLAYSTRTGKDLSDSEIILPNPPGPLSQKTGSYSLAYQYEQFLHQNPDNPRDRWGLFLKAAVSDGNPNIIQNSVIAGIGGAIPGRAQDGFGVGVFRYGMSSALKDTYRPVLTIRDETGMEIYYRASVTPWLQITPDLQVTKPATGVEDKTAVVLALRAKITF